MGFSFRSRGENGLLLLSTFLGQPSGDLGDFYSVSLSRGMLSVVFGHPKNKVKKFSSSFPHYIILKIQVVFYTNVYCLPIN